MQLSETSADGRGISERIGKPWTTNGDVPVDRLMWQAVCVVGKRLAGSSINNNINNNNNNSICLPVINLKHSFIGLEASTLRTKHSSYPAGLDNLFLPILYNKSENLFTHELCKRCWGIWEKLFQSDLSNFRGPE